MLAPRRWFGRRAARPAYEHDVGIPTHDHRPRELGDLKLRARHRGRCLTDEGVGDLNMYKRTPRPAISLHHRSSLYLHHEQADTSYIIVPTSKSRPRHPAATGKDGLASWASAQCAEVLVFFMAFFAGYGDCMAFFAGYGNCMAFFAGYSDATGHALARPCSRPADQLRNLHLDIFLLLRHLP